MIASQPPFSVKRTPLAGALFAILRPQDASAATVHPEALQLALSGHTHRLALPDVHAVKARQGRYWSLVQIRHAHGATIVSGLKPPRAKALVNAVEAARRDWWHRALAARVDALRSVHKRLGELHDPPRYLNSDSFRELSADARAAVRDLPRHWPESIAQAPEIRMLNDILAFLRAPDDALTKANRTFVANELDRSRALFDRIEARPLTDEQRNAVVIDERRNLVVAAAGSGKTSVIVAKAAWLLHKKYLEPSEILLLAFARDARNEMNDRIRKRIGAASGGGVSVRTFHSLALAIVGEAEGKRPALSPVAESETKLHEHIGTKLRELVAQDVFSQALLEWFQGQFSPRESHHEFQTWGDYHNYIRSNDIRSLQGEQVRSMEECEIANFLFLHRVAYQYEAPYEHDTATAKKQQYRPDFFLPDHGIYIEHFALNAAGEPPPFVDRDSYLADIEWKRELHAEHGTLLIETHSHQRDNATLLRDLARRLALRGVPLTRIPREGIFDVLEQQGKIEPFTRLLATFLQHFKSSQMSFDELAARADKRKDPARARAFLAIFRPLFERYQRDLADAGEVDFHDMIERATRHLQRGLWPSPYRYILVDEFQDISPARARLLKALLRAAQPSQLFAVGDDWQAIYRFGGSDIAVMRDFEQHFGHHECIHLQTTFRCADRIADLATQFVLRNPAQITKRLTATRTADGPAVHIGLPDPDQPLSLLDQALKRIQAHAASQAGNSSVLLLGRYHRRKPPDMQQLATRYRGLRISFMTVHAAKGLEADYVIVLGLHAGKYGFPVQIADDPLIDLVLSAPERHPNAEERRLFYVALTRAKRQVYLLAGAVPSEFIRELMEDDFDVQCFGRRPEADVPCPVCLRGRMERRENPRNETVFYGCSNWPYCEHTSPPCPKCGTGLPRRSENGHSCPDCGATIEACPDCEGWLETRMGPYGRFLGCSNYPACNFSRDLRQSPARSGRTAHKPTRRRPSPP